MSNGEILYVKGMNMSISDEDADSDENVWDDTELTAAYDRALRVANVEVAKRIAMSTNTNKQEGNSAPTNQKMKQQLKPQSGANTQNQPPPSIWKAGMACRAVYEVDGLPYEAFVLRIINNKECVVRFLGYENSEVVPISSLKPSLGKEVRAKQIQEALDEDLQINGVEDNAVKTEVAQGNNDCDSENLTADSCSDSNNKKKKKSKQKKQHRKNNGLELPELPFQMPMMSQFGNFGMDCPIPPPPVTLMQSEGPSTEDQAVSSMLLSWYMSGYSTGYYQGMKRAKDKRKKHH